MLAEIFIIRLEAAARALREPLPSSTSRFVPFNPSAQFTFEDKSHRPAAAALEETTDLGSGSDRVGATLSDAEERIRQHHHG